MNFFVLRRGQKLGPYPDSAVDEMSAKGELRAGDLVCYEGEQNWLPVSRFMEHRQQRPEPVEANEEPAGEPETETDASASASAPSKTSFLRRSVEETDEATMTDAEREVVAGGHFVIYEYCWSLLLSFKHASPPVLVRAGDDGFGPALRYSLISFCFGWWGIPGPVWVFTTLRHNARGGRDITLETLTRQVGHARAAAACARHQTSAEPGVLLRSLGGVLTVLSLALWLGIGWLGFAFAQGELGERATGPGAKEFEDANKPLLAARKSSFFANVTKALELGDVFNRGVRESYLSLARQNPGVDGMETNNLTIASYCELHQDRVVFLVQIPGLQKLPAQIRNRLADDAWRTSSLALTELKAGFTDLRVAVGVRSAGKYDQVLMGRYVRDFEENNTGLKSRAEGPRSKTKLYPLFVPMDQLTSWKDE